MEFNFNTDEDRGECVAYLFHMDGEPEEISLAVYQDDGKVITFYYDGGIFCQEDFLEDVTTSGSLIKKFYKGDSVTITF